MREEKLRADVRDEAQRVLVVEEHDVHAAGARRSA